MTNFSNSNGNSSDCSSSSSSSSSSSIGNLNGNNSKTNSVSLNQSTSPNGQSSSNPKSSNSDNANAILSTQQSSQATEKPAHYTYLKGFRVEQCSLFLQHKCTQHRPYTCFYWHFKNQRRRRPLRKRDGTFNYNPDTYCDKYDEQSGVCSNSDECPYVHRNAGDTEKRYHLRYYKTATCIHETDTKGNCSKNGVHCAFAHGAADMRPPVYDIRELQLQQAQLNQQQSSSLSVSSVSSSSSNSQHQSNINNINGVSLNGGLNSNGLSEQFNQQNSPGNSGDLMNEKTLNLSTSLEKERLLNEDPKWNETSYVLTNYKTEQCRRPPRLCRQGFACPQYHNARDKRRNPNLFKYRSTPCPNVKQGDDWLEPTVCDNGDLCKYCHSRTEQQFHPEIYKSSKCNDMNTTGYCPRGPFCAFAHIEQELKNQRAHSNSESSNSDYTLENFISNALPSKETTEHDQQQQQQNNETASGSNSNFNGNHHQNEEYTSYIEIVNQNNESSSSTNSLNSHAIQNGGGGSSKNSNSLVMTSTQQSSSASSSAATLLQQQMLAAANNAYTCKPIGSEREKPKGSSSQIQQMQSQQVVQQQSQHISSSSKQIINETDTANTAQLNLNNGSSNSNQQQHNSSSTSSTGTCTNTNINNNQNLLNEIDNSTIEKLRHDLFRQAEVSNKLETLCLQYRQWVEKLTIDVNEWKTKYSRCDSEKKNLELQLFNKQCLEQNIAPLRNANFNLNGNSNDLIDGNDLTKLLNFNSNNTNLIQNTSLNNNNNNINSINKK